MLAEGARATHDVDKISSSTLTFKYPVTLAKDLTGDSPFVLPFYWELPTDGPLIDVLLDTYKKNPRAAHDPR